MKKTIKTLLVAILAIVVCFSIIPVKDANAAFNGIIKVRVSPKNYSSSIRVSVKGDYFIKEKKSIVLNAGEYEVKKSGSSVQLLQNNSLLYSGSKITFLRANTNNDYDFIIFHDSPTYRGQTLYFYGDMEFRVSSGLCAINHVYVEDYVAGVLPYEMSMSWPIEALKAQAVAARNYGVSAAIWNSGDIYYLSDTTSSQVYKGIPWIDSSGDVEQEEYEKLKKIIDGTDRKVMKYNGSVFSAYFSAWNGGETLTAKGWTGNTSSAYGYTVVKADPYDDKRCQSSYWISRTINTDLSIGKPGDYNEDIQNMLIAKYRDKYSVSSKTPVSITSTNGIKGMDSTEPLVSIVFEEFYCDVYFSTETSKKRIYFTDTDLKNALGISSSYRAFRIENSSSGKTLLHNVRYGHGVGMSQRGAQQMADEGKSYKSILNFYYDYDSITTLSVSRPSLPSMPEQSSTDIKYKAKVVNVNSYVNVRSGPGTNYSKIGEATKGSVLTVKQEYYTNKWHQVLFNGKTGYIYSYYIQLIPVVDDGKAKLSSSTYEVDTSSGALKGVCYNETVGDIINRLDCSSGTISIYSGSTKLSSGSKPKTGMTVKLIVDGSVSDQLTVIVKGDVNGDGKVSITDYTLARLDILGLKKLSGTKKLGADTNGDGKISITDYSMMRLEILGHKKLYRR